MKRRFGFTVIEMLIIIVVIGVLITVGGFGYSSYNNRARTDHTKRLVEEVVHKMDIYKSANSAYPGELGDDNDPSSLISSLSSEARERVLQGLDHSPSVEYPKNIEIIFCYRPPQIDVPVGAKINYWDSSHRTVQTTNFGNATEAGVKCL